MSFFDDVGLRAAEGLEASVGPYVALASYKRLYAGPPEIRAKAALGALRCAVALDDDAEIAAVSDVWRTAREAPQSATPYACRLLLRNKAGLAMRLAAAEEERSRAPRASYVRLRAEEQLGGPPAPWRVDGWRALVARAQRDGDAAVATHASAHLLTTLFARAASDPAAVLSRAELAALGEAASLDLARPTERITLLRARLFSVHRFHRGAALSALEEIARRHEGPLQVEAVAVAARHFSALFTRLDAIEIDRIAATLKHWPNETTRKIVLAQLPAWVRVIAALRASPADVEPKLEAAIAGLSATSAEVARGLAHARADGELHGAASRPLGRSADEVLAWTGVDAVSAVDRDDGEAAERLFGQALAAIGPDVSLPPALWVAAHRALLRAPPATQGAAATLIDQALCRTASVPHRPLVDIAAALSRVGRSDAAARALAEAGRWREPGAGPMLADEKRRGGYAALARGDRSAALALLTEARAWLTAEGPRS